MAGRGQRTDIQGMRALAVGIVVLFHCGVPWLPGGYVGVDVFFVISGFLITTHLLSSLTGAGGISFADFYARRARRILPASLVVVALTVLASILWVPPLMLRQMFNAAIATALYVPNVLFAVQGTDYLAETTPSVFQHYWSLGVEEQFYLVWPAVLALAFHLCRRSTRGLFAVIAVIVAASFVGGLVLTFTNPPWAFFSLPTRAWELGAGGLLAMVMRTDPAWVRSRAAGAAAWLGLAAIVGASLLFDETTLFPGYAALLPVLGAVLMIAGGDVGTSWSPGRAMSLKPLQLLGLISYSVYLVHWPLIVIPQQAASPSAPLPPGALLALGAASVPLGALLYRFVETPFRNPPALVAARPRRSLLLAGAASVVIVVFSATAAQAISAQRLDSGTAAPVIAPRAHPVGTAFVASNIRPALRLTSDDNPSIYDDGCHRDIPSTDASACTFGSDPDAPRVVLFGDSHGAQWFPALLPLAETGAILLETDTKSDCPSVLVDPETVEPYPQCESWRSDVIERLNAAPPALIVLASYSGHYRPPATSAESYGEQWHAALEKTVAALPAVPVDWITDTPHQESTPSICLSAHLDDADACAVDRDDAIDMALQEQERTVDGIGWIDMNDYVCGPEKCPAVIGSYLVYRDRDHLTATYSRALSELLAAKLDLGSRDGDRDRDRDGDR
ncbi:acyltransferase family protein [Leifsonia sp. YIM 134122]|uniref:Acyltransferase family protein n=1 Tax=Leifsonia stereocauli TaxID=3134136 RepID=A0ABU9W4E7_9MICO